MVLLIHSFYIITFHLSQVIACWNSLSTEILYGYLLYNLDFASNMYGTSLSPAAVNTMNGSSKRPLDQVIETCQCFGFVYGENGNPRDLGWLGG